MANKFRQSKTRRLIAATAARIMVEESIEDYLSAKRKAVIRLGLEDVGHLPRNDEIEQLVIEYQHLFRSDSQPRWLEELRRTAISCMRRLADFQPRLVGTVLNGTADQHSEINLHLFCDTPESVMLFLLDHGIDFESGDRLIRFANGGNPVVYPKYRFYADHTPIEVTVFPERGLRQAPLSPIDGKPMRRASLTSVVKLVEQADNETP